MGAEVAEHEEYEEYEDATGVVEETVPAPVPPEEPRAELTLSPRWMLILAGGALAAGLVTASLYLAEQAALRGPRSTTQPPPSTARR